MSSKQFDIIHGKENYVVLIDGEFYCTADTIEEARIEVMKYQDEHGE